MVEHLACLPRRYVEDMAQLPCWLPAGSAGVAPEVNLREHLTHMPPPNMNKADHPGFETHRRRHLKSKTGISGPTKRIHVLPNFF